VRREVNAVPESIADFMLARHSQSTIAFERLRMQPCKWSANGKASFG
jgi:hypothetical protein